MLPEVQEYFDAIAKVNETWDKERERLTKERGGTYSNEWYNAVDKQDNDRAMGRRKAREKLQQNAKHPVVKWIVSPKNEVYDHGYLWAHAEDILRALPATEEQLNDIAEKGNWCGTWERLRDKALADGVLDGYTVLQYQQNDKPWQEFKRSVRMSDGETLSREDIMKWFKRGAKTFEFSIRRSTYRFRLVNTDPYK